MSQLFHKPNSPAIPDYAKLAQQQGQENEKAATQTAKLGSPNEETPWGSIERTYDPGTGQFTYTTSLTADQQKLFDAGEDIDLSKMELGKQQIGNLSDLWSHPFDTEGMTERVTSVAPSNLQTSFDKTNYSLNPGATRDFQQSVDGTGVQRSVSGSAFQTDPGATGSFRNTVASQPLQRSVAGSRYSLDTGEAPGYRSALDLGKLGNRPTLDFGDLPALPGVGDFGGERQRVEDAMYTQQSSRLDPEWKQREDALRDRLYSQGIREGNPAWSQAFDEFSRQRNDAYDTARRSSITGAGAEQSRLFGMASASRGQAAQEALASAGFELDSRSQGVAEALTSGNFENAVVQLERQYGLERQAAINMATELQNSFDLSSAQFGNTASGQAFDQDVTAKNLWNTTEQLDRNYGLDRQSAVNSGTQMQNAFNLSQGEFFNSAAGQEFSQMLARGDFANAVNTLERQYGLDRQAATNLATRMQNELEMQGAAFNNASEGQRFDEDMSNALLANRSRGEEIDEAAFKRRLPFDEFSAINSGTQVQPPQFGGPTVAPGVNGAPIYQAGQDTYAAQYKVYEQKMQQLNALWGAIAEAAPDSVMSDARLKKNIRRIGTLQSGLPIYAYEIFGRHEVGVLAQEAREIFPDAVSMHPSGYLMVNYSRIG